MTAHRPDASQDQGGGFAATPLGCAPEQSTLPVALQFGAECNPSPERVRELAASAPANPFCTVGFIDARRASGAQPWILVLREDRILVTGCAAFLSTGRLNRTLEIHSLPAIAKSDPFWGALRAFCREQRVTRLRLMSFGSPAADIPRVGSELWRKRRTEYVLDLAGSSLWGALSSNHNRNIRRARKSGVVVERVMDPAAFDAHARLISASMARRLDRGEQLSIDADARRFAVYAEHGIGELFQAKLGGQAVSSILVFTAESGGYYHSAGTSPEGMGAGASQFLIQCVSETLRERGYSQFNLGGADADQAGLARFKSGFGARAVALEAAEFTLGGRLANALRAAMRSLASR